MEKIKQILEGGQGRQVLIVIIVVLVATSAFELGRLSKASSSAGIKILSTPAEEYSPSPVPASTQSASALTAVHSSIKPAAAATSKNFFASSRGSKYYPAGCTAGKSLKPENRIYFATREEAEKSGYELSSSCR